MEWRTYYWVQPIKEHEKILSDIIRKLSSELDSPIFEPHMTIYGGPASDEDNAESILKASWGRRKEFALDVQSIRYTSDLSKSLFIQLEQSPWLKRVCRNIRGLVKNPGPFEVDPHISLAYKEMSLANKAKLAKKIKLPLENIQFDTLVAKRSPARTGSDLMVEKWEKIVTYKFT